MAFTDNWRHLSAAARRAPADPAPALDVERILAARREQAARAPRIVRIGWFPPALAAAAVLACIISVGAGLDPLPPAREAGGFLATLPRQVPHAPDLRTQLLSEQLGMPAWSTADLPSTATIVDGLVRGAASFVQPSAEPAP